MNEPPVEFVYCWCNGADPEFWAEKARYSPGAETRDDADCRYIDNGELVRSLASVALYAPWIRRIWLLVNDVSAIPPAVARDPRIVVVRHREVIPAEHLPLFNALSIELWLDRIPDLSERFVYLNDDTFLGAPVTPRDFFTDDGKVICRYFRNRIVPSGGAYEAALLNARAFLRDVAADHPLDREWLKAAPYYPHHNADGCLKGVFSDFRASFPEPLTASASCRFHTPGQFSRDIFSLWAMATGRGVFRGIWRNRIVRRLGWPRAESAFGKLSNADVFETIERHRPSFFCLNDTEESTDAQRARLRSWLERRFP